MTIIYLYLAFFTGYLAHYYLNGKKVMKSYDEGWRAGYDLGCGEGLEGAEENG